MHGPHYLYELASSAISVRIVSCRCSTLILANALGLINRDSHAASEERHSHTSSRSMNGTEGQAIFPSVFSYLNQSASSLVPDGVFFSSVINYPYRIGLSVINATKLQYEQAISSEELIPSLQSLIDTIGYFFSSYAVASFVTALILNRFVIMASLRSNTTRVSLPIWSRLILHLSAIIPLLYNVIQTLSQVQLIRVLPTVDFPLYLARTFTIFAWSHCVETLVTTTTNSKPLEESDYTIFELSVQFYYLSQRNYYVVMAPEYLSDCLMALLGRVWIHVVELFNIRKYRLAGSTLLNVINITFLFYQMRKYGLESIPVSTRYRHFPKIFSLFLILISVMSYALACLVRKNPFGSHQADTKDLQFYSFMHNWWNHLNCTGEEEFSHVVNKLALLLCNGNESLNKGIHREFSSLNHPAKIHHTYMISGYLNKVNTIPDDINSESSLLERPGQRLGTPALISKFKITYSLLSAGFTFFVKRKWQIKSSTDQESLAACEARKLRDFNRFVTEKNYAKFLKKADANNKDDREPSLLPEEDYSADYQPSMDEADSDSDAASLGDNDDEVDEDLLGVTTPKDMDWFMSMWPILKLHVERDTRLTRSQYATSNAHEILEDVILQRALAGGTEYRAREDSDDDDSRSNCVVCKMSPRNVVLWPCTCFALCEDCRVSLGLRGFTSCVCCRTEIHGYSRLNNV